MNGLRRAATRTIVCRRAPPTTAISTLSLHDALPIFDERGRGEHGGDFELLAPARAIGIYEGGLVPVDAGDILYRYRDRKSTRLNSSHQIISYAVFCLKKKNRPRHSHCVQQAYPHQMH